jgi:hypothetical protein
VVVAVVLVKLALMEDPQEQHLPLMVKVVTDSKFKSQGIQTITTTGQVVVEVELGLL